MDQPSDTIFALASARGRAGVAVVRVSGPSAFSALRGLAKGIDTEPNPREAIRVNLYESESNGGREKIDDALAIWFPGPRSFTGEDVVELHVHGGGAVIDALLMSLGAREGLRLAEPGEFSRRAFENGKMDLTSVEAIADLVDAETAEQRRQALTQMGGALAQIYDGWRTQLVEALAYLEACIDFSEEDIPDNLMTESASALQALHQEISAHLNDNSVGERIRDGFRIVLTGTPNVGKSSLLNALAKRDVAIVTDRAGTTRDVLEVFLDLGGYPATLVDTAGLRETEDVIEQEGVRRAVAQVDAADIAIFIVDATEPCDLLGIDSETLVVMNKCDLLDETASANAEFQAIRISATEGTGLPELIDVLQSRVKEIADRTVAEHPPLTRMRHRQALEDCLAALRGALENSNRGRELEIIAEDMRAAAQALARITGRVDVEDLLDKIFRDFCIGK